MNDGQLAGQLAGLLRTDSNLAEYVAVLRSERGGQNARIIARSPAADRPGGPLPPAEALAPFCFLGDARPRSAYQVRHSFVLTSELGLRLYGVCLSDETGTTGDGDSELQCILLLSRHAYLACFQHYLSALLAFHSAPSAATTTSRLLSLTAELRPPVATATLQTDLQAVDSLSDFRFSAPGRGALLDIDVAQTLRLMGVERLIDVWSLVLLEVPLLLFSHDAARLTEAAQAIIELLSPLRWSSADTFCRSISEHADGERRRT